VNSVFPLFRGSIVVVFIVLSGAASSAAFRIIIFLKEWEGLGGLAQGFNEIFIRDIAVVLIVGGGHFRCYMLAEVQLSASRVTPILRVYEVNL
jgi:hypothetical protein